VEKNDENQNFPACNSKKYKLFIPDSGTWKCENCGYQGSIVIEDGNLEKQIKTSKKMEKLQKKMLRGRY
jgi:ribosomal protein L37AE/L43A